MELCLNIINILPYNSSCVLQIDIISYITGFMIQQLIIMVNIYIYILKKKEEL